MFNLGPMEMIIVMGIAVLLFGKRLPEVGRSLGKGIVEFKKGLNGVADELDISGTGRSSSSYGSSWRSDERPAAEPAYTDASVPKFELPGAPRPLLRRRRWSIKPGATRLTTTRRGQSTHHRNGGRNWSLIGKAATGRGPRPGAPARRLGGPGRLLASPVGLGLDQERRDGPRPLVAVVERDVQGIAHRDLARSDASIGSAKISIRVSIDVRPT